MTNYTAAGCSKYATLTANTVDVVTLDGPYPYAEVINWDSSTTLWVTIDRGASTTAPTVGGDGCWPIGPGGARILQDDPWGNQGPTVVRLIASSAIAYSVVGILKEDHT